jgi:hypothetical protein
VGAGQLQQVSAVGEYPAGVGELPGRLYFEAEQLKRIELLETHPYANALIICLERYYSHRFSG